MSRENLEAAAALYELYERGDIGAMVSRMERSFDVWAEFRVEVEELLDAGDAVVALVRSTAVGQGSGAEVEERIAHVAWMRGGVPYRLKVFADRARALEALGLR